MAEIVFTQKDFVEGYKALPFTLKGSKYSNSFPQNCLYYQGYGVYTADCWNLWKAYVWCKGVLPKVVGKYVYNPGKYGLGDWTGRQIFDKYCFDMALDFSKIIPAEVMLTAAEDHFGTYVGDFSETINGVKYTWNTIESTPIWADGIQATYTDAKGGRFQCKGGAQAGSWKYHAKPVCIDFPNDLTISSKQENNKTIITVDGKGQIEITPNFTIKKL